MEQIGCVHESRIGADHQARAGNDVIGIGQGSLSGQIDHPVGRLVADLFAERIARAAQYDKTTIGSNEINRR